MESPIVISNKPGFSGCIGQSDSSNMNTTSGADTSKTIALIGRNNNEQSNGSGEDFQDSSSTSPPEEPDGKISRIGRMPLWLHRVLLILLAFILPLLELQFKGFYFLALQFIVWKLLRGLKKNPSPPYLLLTFMVNLGVTEEQIMRSRKIIFAATFLWTDFCIFIFSIALSQRAFCQNEGNALAYSLSY